METKHLPVEKHPLDPFLPERSRILMLGSFPPKREKWSMDFFYPNWINDMWRIMGLIFFDDKEHFIARNDDGTMMKKFDKDRIEGFCIDKGISLYDTACEVRRLKDNASDKFLEVVTPADLTALLEKIPECQAIVTTGQKATDVIVETFGCQEPPVGGWTECRLPETQQKCMRSIRFWRMPSSSRAYPLALEKKAGYYRKMFMTENMI